jgi:uncharacterized protein
MTPSNQEKIAELLRSSGCVEVAWLYGSRAANTHSASSDYDLAVAFRSTAVEMNTALTQLDDLQYKLRTTLELPISIVDINRIPVPLAQNIVAQGVVILCTSDLRLRLEEQRIWSLWEEYKFEHEQNRKAL